MGRVRPKGVLFFRLTLKGSEICYFSILEGHQNVLNKEEKKEMAAKAQYTYIKGCQFWQN